MTVLARTRYDHDGDLLQVRAEDLRVPGAYSHGPITFDPGHYHVHVLEGRTERERQALAHRFYDRMADVPGFVLLAVLPTDIIGGRTGSMAPVGYNRYSARMVYAIEERSAR